MSDIEWLNFCIDEARNFGHAEKAGALERIRARLTPDRERVKAHLRGRFDCVLPHLSELAWADIADTAIKAMEGK
jgi:hypothetical protein